MHFKKTIDVISVLDIKCMKFYDQHLLYNHQFLIHFHRYYHNSSFSILYVLVFFSKNGFPFRKKNILFHFRSYLVFILTCLLTLAPSDGSAATLAKAKRLTHFYSVAPLLEKWFACFPTSGDGLQVAFFLYFSNTRRKGQVCVHGKMTVYQNKFIFFLKPSEETVSI